MMNETQRSKSMKASTESKQGADRILSKLLKKESRQLRDALEGGNYDTATRAAYQLGETLKFINKELEARAK
jgi:hypothetical protein